MTPNQFSKLALETPGAEESSHMSHPDLRIGGKVFATLSQGGDFGVPKLTPDQQQSWCDAPHPCSCGQTKYRVRSVNESASISRGAQTG
jgi:hypothetical protein